MFYTLSFHFRAFKLNVSNVYSPEKKHTKHLNPNFSGLPELHLFKHLAYLHAYGTGSWSAFQNCLQLSLFYPPLSQNNFKSTRKGSGGRGS